jgi:hypothetical protein
MAIADWKVTAKSGLSCYLKIQRFPMMEPHEEYVLAKRWREHGDHEGRRTSSSTVIYASSARSPAAMAATACRSLISSRRAMSA